MKKFLVIFLLIAAICSAASFETKRDYGAARKNFSNVTPATGRAALELGTMAVATATDYVATSSLAARVDTINASFTGDIDVTGDVGAATVNGVAPLTAAEKTQALVGSTTVNFNAADYTIRGGEVNAYDAGGVLAIITHKTLVKYSSAAASTTVLAATIGNDSTSVFINIRGYVARRGSDAGIAQIVDRWFCIRRVAGADVVVTDVGGGITNLATLGGSINASASFSIRRIGAEGATEPQSIILDIDPTASATAVEFIFNVSCHGLAAALCL